jgi:hypothetical protein
MTIFVSYRDSPEKNRVGSTQRNNNANVVRI